MTRLYLRSAKGRALVLDKGEEQAIEVEVREPSLTYRTPDGLIGQFVAQEVDADGVWIYRRVGVERD